MLRFATLALSLVLPLALVAEAARGPGGMSLHGATPLVDRSFYDEPRLSKRVVTTGCTCFGLAFKPDFGNPDAPYYMLLTGTGGVPDYGGPHNPTGWCFKDGAMLPEWQQHIQDALAGGENTIWVNVTNALAKCAFWGWGTGAACATKIIQDAAQTYVLPGGCTYPPANFEPTDCKCAYDCSPGYVKCGTTYCIDPATQQCQSGAPAPLRRRSLGSCLPGFTTCPTGGRGWECIDTETNLEACGGCPDTTGSVDCSALPGVSKVECLAGSCVASACRTGYTLNGGVCARA